MIDATRPRPVRHPSAPSATAHDNQGLAAAAAALTPTPPGRALFGTDTSGLAQSYILYSGREVLLPIGAFLGNVLSPGSGHAAGRHQPALGGLRRRSAELVALQQAPPRPRPDRSPPCRGKPQGAGPDIPDASHIPPPPGCRSEQSPPRGTGHARLQQPGTGTGITMSGPEPDRVSSPAPADVPRHRGQWAGPASGGWRAGVKVDDQRGVRRVRQATGWGQEKYAGSVAEDLRPRTWGISGRGACRARPPGGEG